MAAPGILEVLPRNAGDDQVGAKLTLFQGLQLREHACGAGAVSAAGKRSYRVDGWISSNDIREGAHLFRHFGKRSVLVSLNEAIDAAGILLGKKSFVDGAKHLNAEKRGAEW